MFKQVNSTFENAGVLCRTGGEQSRAAPNGIVVSQRGTRTRLGRWDARDTGRDHDNSIDRL